jgi:hypothetical protein
MSAPVPKGPDPAALSAMLANRIADVIAALGVDGRASHGRFTAIAPWPSDDKEAKLSIRLRGTPGQWIHWTSGMKGDALDLVAAVLDGSGGKDRKAAVRWALDFLGLADRPGEDAAARAARRAHADAMAAQARQRAAAQEAAARKALARDRGVAHARWLDAKPLAPGDAGWIYLTARGVDPARLARPPGALRLAERFAHVDETTGEETIWPCLMSAMTLIDGRFGALHMTWLDPSRPGRKAPVTPARRMWPSPLDADAGGAAIRLARGRSGLPVLRAPERSDLVVVCEGVEDGLSLALLFPDARVEAAGSLSLFGHWRPPACAREVRVAGDRDWDKPQAEALLRSSVAKIAARAGPAVKTGLIWPPENFKDWNEALMATRVHGGTGR